MDILSMPIMDDRYHLLVEAREYRSRWAEARPQKHGTSEKVADFIYNEVICQFRIPESVKSRRRCREQEMQRLPPPELQYAEDHRDPIRCHC